MSLGVVLVAIVVLVLLVAGAKLHPFLAFLVVSIGMALALGVPPNAVPAVVQKGLGGILGSLTTVIVVGAMLGKLVVESGAAQRIATALVARTGVARIGWAMAATGFIVGVPLFYSVGFVLVVPLIFAVSGRYGLPAVGVGLPALAALSVAHGLLPPHPSPTGLVAQFGADLGLTLLYGTVIAIPALVLAGPVYARFVKSVPARPLPGLEATLLPEDRLPGLWTSLLTALLPAVLLIAATVVQIMSPQTMNEKMVAWPENRVGPLLVFFSHPDVVMLVTLAVATVTLGLARGRSLANVMAIYTAALVDVGPILLVIGGSGPFKEVLTATGVDKEIAKQLQGFALDPLVLAWVVTVSIRVCVGSATVAGLTAAGILAPMVAAPDSGIDPNLMVLAVGSGSLAASHVNDAGFWLFKEYFNASIRDTLKCWTVMETIVAVVGLAGTLVRSRLLG
ncbi:MAG: gluconate:H+ symporter [Planctomycetia bacterium]